MTDKEEKDARNKKCYKLRLLIRSTSLLQAIRNCYRKCFTLKFTNMTHSIDGGGCGGGGCC
jgi:hypothetical protein